MLRVSVFGAQATLLPLTPYCRPMLVPVSSVARNSRGYNRPCTADRPHKRIRLEGWLFFESRDLSP